MREAGERRELDVCSQGVCGWVKSADGDSTVCPYCDTLCIRGWFIPESSVEELVELLREALERCLVALDWVNGQRHLARDRKPINDWDECSESTRVASESAASVLDYFKWEEGGVADVGGTA